MTIKRTDLSLLKDADTILMANDEVDAGIALMEALVELKALRALLGSEAPVCPHCKAQMTPVSYKGYYESFDYWECECQNIPEATKWRGYCG